MDFLSDFLIVFIAQVILFQLLFLSPEIFKIKISKTKSPRIDPFVSFPFNLLRNRSKKIDKGQKEKKRWAFLGTEERILLGDRVRKEILQGFIFLFYFVDSFLGRFLSSVSLRLGCSADVLISLPRCLMCVSLCCVCLC